MNVPHSNYAQIAAYYDQARGLWPEFIDFQIASVIHWARIGPGDRVLDVGCGTGRFTVPIAAQTGAEVYGLEPAAEMLAKALAKPDAGRVSWTQGRAEQLPFAEGTFDVVMLMMVIHHIEDRPAALSELYRVLRPGGRALIFTAAHGQIRRYVLKDFPGVVAIDLRRFPTIPTLQRLLRETGFPRVGYHLVHYFGGYVPTDDFLAQVRSKFISTLSLLSAEAFARGYAICEKALRVQYGERMPFTRDYTFLVGEK
jgi:SAM-dependent methyltransferase